MSNRKRLFFKMSKIIEDLENQKDGVVFTPKKIVNFMLDKVNYNGSEILEKHIIDNSSGDGAFLVEVVKRYIKAYKNKNKSLTNIEVHLEKYIHGIEIDKDSCKDLISNLNLIVEKNNINNVKWDILNKDALNVEKYNNKMDFVVGNPPYIRIHDMIKRDFLNMKFMVSGMKDIYIAFFEIGIKMLEGNGELIYITPNSFFNSKAGSIMRSEIIKNNLLKEIYNLGHYNPFINITTYTAITHLSKKNRKVNFNFFEYKGEKEKLVKSYSKNEFYIDNIFFFSSEKNTNLFKSIREFKETSGILVKNGVATNADKFFFRNWDINDKTIKKSYKISTGKTSKVFYPYDKKGKVIPFKNINIKIQKELIKSETTLKNRDLRGNLWYEFARRQGINDVYKKRICVNNILKGVDSIKIKIIQPGCIAYSGYCIISDEIDFKNIIKKIKGEEFVSYVKSLNKEKSGGYYSFSSVDLSKYLNYSFNSFDNW